MAYAIKHEGQAVTASGLDVLAGIWLLTAGKHATGMKCLTVLPRDAIIW